LKLGLDLKLHIKKMAKLRYMALIGLFPSIISGITFDKPSIAYADPATSTIVNSSEQFDYEAWMESNFPGYLKESKEVAIINRGIRDSLNLEDAKARARRIQIPVVYNGNTYFPNGKVEKGRPQVLNRKSFRSAYATISKELDLELKLSEAPSLPLESDRDPDKLDLLISRMKQYPVLRRLLEQK